MDRIGELWERTFHHRSVLQETLPSSDSNDAQNEVRLEFFTLLSQRINEFFQGHAFKRVIQFQNIYIIFSHKAQVLEEKYTHYSAVIKRRTPYYIPVLNWLV